MIYLELTNESGATESKGPYRGLSLQRDILYVDGQPGYEYFRGTWYQLDEHQMFIFDSYGQAIKYSVITLSF